MFYVTEHAVTIAKDNLMKMGKVGPHGSTLVAIWAEVHGVPVINIPERNLPKRGVGPGACLVPYCQSMRYVVETKSGSTTRRTIKSTLCEAHAHKLNNPLEFVSGPIITQLCRYLEPWYLEENKYYLVFEANPESVRHMITSMKVGLLPLIDSYLPYNPGYGERDWCECKFFNAKVKDDDDCIAYGPAEEAIMWWFITNFAAPKTEDDLNIMMNDTTEKFTNIKVVDSDDEEGDGDEYD